MIQPSCLRCELGRYGLDRMPLFAQPRQPWSCTWAFFRPSKQLLAKLKFPWWREHLCLWSRVYSSSDWYWLVPRQTILISFPDHVFTLSARLQPGVSILLVVQYKYMYMYMYLRSLCSQSEECYGVYQGLLRDSSQVSHCKAIAP